MIESQLQVLTSVGSTWFVY